MADLAEAFNKLPDRHARREFFAHILPKLSDQDWRDLQTSLRARRFQFDIVSHLPIELFVQVFKHLNVQDILRHGGVCKRWHALLNNPALFKLLLGPDFNVPLHYETSLDAAALRGRAKRHQLFSSCRPTWRRRWKRPISYARMGLTSAGQRMYDFCDGMTAAITVPDNAPSNSTEEVVELRNFYTGKQRVFRGRGRERISCLTLTDRICGWASFNSTCYACDVLTGEQHSFRLPSANVHVFSGRGEDLAAVCGTTTSGYSLHLWNWNNQRSQSFSIPSDVINIFYFGLAIDAMRSRITVFHHSKERRGSEDGKTFVSFSTYSMEGTLIASGKSPHPCNFRFRDNIDMRACDTEGNYVIACLSNPDLDDRLKVIIFNENTLSFTHRVYHGLLEYSAWFLWRTTVYAIQDLNDEWSEESDEDQDQDEEDEDEDKHGGVCIHVYDYTAECPLDNLISFGYTSDTFMQEEDGAADPDVPPDKGCENYLVNRYTRYHHPSGSTTSASWLRMFGNDTFLQIIDDSVRVEDHSEIYTDTLCFEDGISPPAGIEDFTLVKMLPNR